MRIEDQLKAEKQPVVEECEKCWRILPDGTCNAYAFPKAKWRNGPCNLASHVRVEEEKTKVKVRVGQQKQKKR